MLAGFLRGHTVRAFSIDRQDVLGQPPYALGGGQWHIPALRILLEKIIPERATMDAFEVEHEFPRIGRRIMLLNARAVFYADHSQTTLLLAFEDVTERRTVEREKAELLRQTEELLRQKDVLLRELEHRVANSLQIIASILRAADGKHAEVAVKHEQGFAHRVHDGLRERPRIFDVLERLNHAMNAPEPFSLQYGMPREFVCFRS
jgi:hypothetical protein